MLARILFPCVFLMSCQVSSLQHFRQEDSSLIYYDEALTNTGSMTHFPLSRFHRKALGFHASYLQGIRPEHRGHPQDYDEELTETSVTSRTKQRRLRRQEDKDGDRAAAPQAAWNQVRTQDRWTHYPLIPRTPRDTPLKHKPFPRNDSIWNFAEHPEVLLLIMMAVYCCVYVLIMCCVARFLKAKYAPRNKIKNSLVLVCIHMACCCFMFRPSDPSCIRPRECPNAYEDDDCEV